MLFKNLTIYQLPPNFFIDRFTLSDALAKLPVRQPAAGEAVTYGFTFPTPHAFERVIETPNHALVICAEKIEKIIPAAAIKDLLSKKVAEVESKENRKLSKKEIAWFKDEIIFSILPTALTKSTKTYAYLDLSQSAVVVDSSSAKKAEDLLSALRKVLGSLPVVPLSSKLHPEAAFTSWCTAAGSIPDQFTLEQEFELRGFENGIIRVKDRNPATEETYAHVDTGMQVTKLGLTFDDRMTFVLTDALQVKKLKFLDIVQNAVGEIDAENQLQFFLAEQSIQVEAIRNLLMALDYELEFRKPDPIEKPENAVTDEDEDLA